MADIDLIRRDLAGLMHGCAADRRRAAGDTPTGEDIKVVDLFERLEAEAKSLDAAMIADRGPALQRDDLARSLAAHRAALVAEIALVLWPRTMRDVTVWIAERSQSSLRRSPPPPR